MKNKAPIKLFVVGKLDNDTVRLQSQLLVGSDTADFVMEEGKLKHWENGNKGFNFYETDIPYVILNDIKEMERQEL